jgi:crotonobetainyl-CoA hydratase
VNRVVPPAEVVSEAIVMAELIAANAPLAVQANKQLAYEGLASGVAHDTDLWRWHDEIAREVLRSRDAREGPRAFAEVRTPQWSGN